MLTWYIFQVNKDLFHVTWDLKFNVMVLIFDLQIKCFIFSCNMKLISCLHEKMKKMSSSCDFWLFTWNQLKRHICMKLISCLSNQFFSDARTGWMEGWENRQKEHALREMLTKNLHVKLLWFQTCARRHTLCICTSSLDRTVVVVVCQPHRRSFVRIRFWSGSPSHQSHSTHTWLRLKLCRRVPRRLSENRHHQATRCVRPRTAVLYAGLTDSPCGLSAKLLIWVFVEACLGIHWHLVA